MEPSRSDKLTNTELQLDHRLSQAILDTLPYPLAVIGENGCIIGVNKAWTGHADTIGNPEPAGFRVGANYLELARSAFSPYSEKGNAAYSGIKEVLKGSISQFSLEYFCPLPSEQRWFRMTASPIAAKPIKAVVSHLDITTHRRMDDSFRESVERFEELIEHLHQVFWMSEAKTHRLLYISPAYETIWGRTCQSLYEHNDSWMDAIHPEDRESVAGVVQKKLDTGEYESQYRILRPDGSIRWIWDRGYAVHNDQGEIIRFVGIADDITERKSGDEETAKLAAIIEYADDAIVSVTLNGIVISWNQGAERLYGYSAEEIIGHSILLLHPPEKHYEYNTIMGRAKAGERIAAFDTVRLRKDGTLIDVSLSVAAIEVQKGHVTGVSKISHDISKLKQLEEQVRQAQKMEAVGTLAGGVAHDFNNLLTVINGYSEILINRLAPDDSAQECLTEIYKAGTRAKSLIEQLLAFSRRQLLEPKVICLNDIVADTENMLRRLIGEDIVMRVVLAPALAFVKVDPGQIQQVLINLAVNARDAMPQGGQLNVETCDVTLDEKYNQSHLEVPAGSYSMLSVTDTGMGMNEATKARIFEPFFTTKEVGKGTGLGMAVVHGIVKQSGGHIEVYSEVGCGSAFKVYLPQVKEASPSHESSPVVRTMPNGSETLLLVEDDDAVRTFERRILASCGYKLLEASNGPEAIRLAQAHEGPIHLVLSDVVMPHMGGQQLAERLTAIRPGLKILFVSGYTDDAIVRRGIIEADVAFLQKPFTPPTLARKVRSLLDDTA